MTEAEIIKLYNGIIEGEYDSLEPSKIWHDSYVEIKSEVEAMRMRLTSGGTINKETDKDFLEKLFVEKFNGAARVPKGTIEKDDFEKLIGKSDFMESLENLIKDPCGDTGQRLFGYVRRYGCKDILINRIIAASVEKTSSPVSPYVFSKVFDYLVKNNIITEERHEADNPLNPIAEWYEKSLHMKEELKNIIKKGINAEPDSTFVSMLPWYIFIKEIKKKGF